MNASPLTAPKPTSSIAMFRRWLLRIHGTILTLVALGSALATTIGWMTGTGLFGFMQQNPMVWVGLIQAYLLMTIIAVLLVLGSGQANARKWKDRIEIKEETCTLQECFCYTVAAARVLTSGKPA